MNALIGFLESWIKSKEAYQKLICIRKDVNSLQVVKDESDISRDCLIVPIILMTGNQMDRLAFYTHWDDFEFFHATTFGLMDFITKRFNGYNVKFQISEVFTHPVDIRYYEATGDTTWGKKEDQ